MRRALALLFVAVGSASALHAAQVFATRTEVVRLDVLVTEREHGGLVRGLTVDDFQIQDNRVSQRADLVAFEQMPLNVALALDMSDSVAGEKLTNLRAATERLLDGLTPDDQAGLVTFSHRLTQGAPLTKDLSAVRRALDALEPTGETSVIDAAYAGLCVAESDVGRGLLIVFSDGVDTASWLSAKAVIDIVRRADVVVYAVAVQSADRSGFLRELTAASGGRLYEIEKTANLAAVFLDVLDEFRHRYLVSYTPRGVSPTGWHRLDVGVRGRRVVVKARPGYLIGN